MQVLLPRWQTVVVVSSGGDRREDYRRVPVSAGPSRLSSPISRHHQGKGTRQLRPSDDNIYGDCFRRRASRRVSCSRLLGVGSGELESSRHLEKPEEDASYGIHTRFRVPVGVTVSSDFLESLEQPEPFRPRKHRISSVTICLISTDLSLQACDLPLYWKVPLFLAAGGDQTGYVEMNAFLDFWKEYVPRPDENLPPRARYSRCVTRRNFIRTVKRR